MLVSSFGCSYETADIEFGFTLSQALDRGNNLAHHLIQSFEPGEVDYQKAHEIGKQLADAVTKGQYEYVLTTHIDKGHIHNHIIFCAVNFVDYHKYVFQQAHLLRNTQHQRQAVPGKRLVRPCARRKAASAFRIEDFCSCVSFFAENSLKAAVRASASRPLKNTR